MSRPVPLLFALCCPLFFFALGDHQLQGSTEARVAGNAMEMHLDNDSNTLPELTDGSPRQQKTRSPFGLRVLLFNANSIHWLGLSRR
ncbi:hypothetical protein DOZ80_04765 [Pseudomonas fluorescens]|uniref:Uncharacterized protein n=1 Tax=Pseudomonas fluorescens TaxID=294 RepID=A0A327NAK3_PSEFL|nr:hypothetical protein DOZ80_04765 [Pseudomonas fluorescens]